MKTDSRRRQRVARLLVRAELSRLVLIEAHDPDLRRVTITDVEMPPRSASRRASTSPASAARTSARGAAAALDRAAGISAPRGRPALPAALRAGAPLPLDRSLERGARIEELLREGPAAADEPTRTTSRERRGTSARCAAPRLPPPDRQAGGPHVARRRRAGAPRRPACPASATAERSTRWRRDSCCSARAARRGSRASSRVMDKSYEGTIRLGPRDDDLRPRGRDRRPGPRRRRGVTARGSSRRPPRRSAASSCRRRRRTRPRRSAAASSTRWRARARPCRSMPKKVRVTRLDVRRARRRAALAVLDRLLLGHVHPLDRARARRAASAAARTSSRCAARASATSRVADAVAARALRGDAAEERLAAAARRAALPRPVPVPADPLASLEAWKIRRGQSVPARGVDGPRGRLGHPRRTRRRDARARPGHPDRRPEA